MKMLKMSRLILPVLFITVGLLFIGCDLDNEDLSTKETGSGSAPGLVGTWVMGCSMDSGGSYYTITSLIFTDTGSMSYQENRFSDAVCTSSITGDPPMSGTYIIGDGKTTSDTKEPVWELDLRITSPGTDTVLTIYTVKDGNKFYWGSGDGGAIGGDGYPTYLSSSEVFHKQ